MKETAQRRKPIQEDLLSLCAILFCAALVRFLWVWLRGFGIFNSDQAVIGLMGKHILEGRPMVYFYGQGYMGSLEAFAAAFFFYARGMSLASLQCAPLLFYFGFLTVNFFLIKRIFGSGVSFTANLLLAVSPPALSVLSMTSLGGYPETLFFGSLVLLGWVCYERSKSSKTLFLTGLAAGIGFWVNNLILMYFFAGMLYGLLKSSFWEKHCTKKSVPDFFFFRINGAPFFLRLLVSAVHLGIAGFLLWHTFSFFAGPKPFSLMGHVITPASPVFHVKKMKGILALLCFEGVAVILFREGLRVCLKTVKALAPFAAGFLIGGSPSFLYTLIGGEGYRVIHGAGMVYFRELPSQMTEVILDGLLGNILAVPVETFKGPLSAGLLSLVILIFSALLFTGFFKAHSKEGRAFLKLKPADYSYAIYPLMLLTVNLAICLFCNLKSSRYLMPVYFSASLIAALGASEINNRNKWMARVLVLGLVLGYAGANYLSLKETPSREALRQDYRDVLREMEKKGVQGGYADYWLSYEMTFLSQEKVIIAPYHSEDRYPAYSQFVSKLEETAYLFLKNRHEVDAFEAALAASGIEYEKKDFKVIRLFRVRSRGVL